MNENERPAIGSSEAAVLTVVELIARAAQMSEQHLAYWLDLYYQVRSRHEAEAENVSLAEKYGCGFGDDSRPPEQSPALDICPAYPRQLSPEESPADAAQREPDPTIEQINARLKKKDRG